MGLLQQLLQNARRPTKMTLELVEFWHFRTPPSDRFPIRKRSAWALRKAKWRIVSLAFRGRFANLDKLIEGLRGDMPGPQRYEHLPSLLRVTAEPGLPTLQPYV